MLGATPGILVRFARTSIRALPPRKRCRRMTLTSAQLTTLEALCRRIVPLPDEPDPAAAALARAVEARLAGMEPVKAKQLAGLLTTLDHPATAALTSGVPVRFTRMPAARQEAWLRTWETSRVPARRTIFQAFRRLVLSTHYARPESFPRIGYRGPLHERAPEVPWEGPLPGASTDDEPVARAAPERARVLHIVPPQLDLMSDPWIRGMTEGA